MTPTRFPGCNVTLGADQPQYRPLPAYRSADGRVLTCWRLTLRERIRILLGYKLWITQLTFGEGFQPVLPEIDNGRPR